MNSHWHEMLDAQGVLQASATPPAAQLNEFVAGKSAVSLVDLSHLSIYEITGDDAKTFLQGQFCNDIEAASSTQAQITGYCTPKGRLLALPTLIGFDAGYRLIMPSDVAEAFIKRLSMFVLRSKVAITRLDDWVAVGIVVSPDGDRNALQALPDALPDDQLSATTGEGSQLVNWHDDISGEVVRSRYLRIAPVNDQLALWQSALPDAHCFPAHAWRLADISAGVPSITQGIVEAFVPQMINLQHVNALSFTKGCYPGQEIVARMQYLGKLKRHMQAFSMPSPDDFASLLSPGAPLCAGEDENAGVIVDALPASSGTCLVLAVTKVAVDNNEFRIGDLKLEPLDLPYALSSSEVA